METQRVFTTAVPTDDASSGCVSILPRCDPAVLTRLRVSSSGRQPPEAARVPAPLQALRLAGDEPRRGSEGHVQELQLPLRILHLLPAGLPRLHPLQGGAAPVLLLLHQEQPAHTRQRSQQEERQAPVSEPRPACYARHVTPDMLRPSLW